MRSAVICAMHTLARQEHCLWPLLLMVLLAGCDRLDMYDQPRYEALEASNFFSDHLSARPRVEGTIPRGGLRDDEAFYTGKAAGKLIGRIPEAAGHAIYSRARQRTAKSGDEVNQDQIRLALLERGRERFEIYCSVCHGRIGDGKGMIVLRGFRKPPSYHIDRLRAAPVGHIFDVMSNGFGAMVSYANRIDVDDRWAIVAYIRALQLSQNASIEDVPEEHRRDLKLQPTQPNAVSSGVRPYRTDDLVHHDSTQRSVAAPLDSPLEDVP